jgi:hypothetical protein
VVAVLPLLDSSVLHRELFLGELSVEFLLPWPESSEEAPDFLELSPDVLDESLDPLEPSDELSDLESEWLPSPA